MSITKKIVQDIVISSSKGINAAVKKNELVLQVIIQLNFKNHVELKGKHSMKCTVRQCIFKFLMSHKCYTVVMKKQYLEKLKKTNCAKFTQNW